MSRKQDIERLFKVIDRSLFTISGSLDYDRVTDAIISLANAVNDYTGDTDEIWYIGESGCCYMADLIVGAYWHFTEWHDGQSSKGYEALSALGQIFSPNLIFGLGHMSTVEDDNEAYMALSDMASHYSQRSVEV
jgi:hypothetical protein